MTPQEKDLTTILLDRLNKTERQKDPEAEALIHQATAERHGAPYYLVQTVLIQDLSLHNAQSRITGLETQLTEIKSTSLAAGGSRIRTLGPPWEKTRSAPIGTPPIGNFCTVYRNSDGFHDLAGKGSQVRTRLAAGGRWIRTCMGLFLSSGGFWFLPVLCSELESRSSSRRLGSGSRSARKGSRDRNGSKAWRLAA